MGFFKNLFADDENSANLNTVSEVSYLKFDSAFCSVYATTIYSKIMHECAQRAMIPDGIDKDGYTITVHDSYSPHKRGLVSIIVGAMVTNDHIFIRKTRATMKDVWLFEKVDKVDAMTGDTVQPDIIELDFREFHEAKIVCLLFDLLGAVLNTLSKNVTIAGALLIKIHALSEMIANSQNLAPLVEQLTQLNDGLTNGRPGYLDAKSSIDYPSFDVTPAESAAKYIFNMISSITGLPNSYLFGEVVGGLGDTSSSDERRMNAAISRYYHSIYSGVVYSVYDRVFDYKRIVSDIVSLVQLFTFIETTTLLTDDGKKKFMINATALDEEDINIGQPNNSPV